ncbi:MAG TPA: zinc ribbon domain-containing protein [Paenibacillaceae bacterium]
MCEYQGFPVADDQLAVKEDQLYLKGYRCRDCGHVMFPAAELCLNCSSEQIEVAPIGREGELIEYTISYTAPEGFEAPLVQAFVRLKEGPEVFALLDATEEEMKETEAGVSLQLVPVIREGRIVGWRFGRKKGMGS